MPISNAAPTTSDGIEASGLTSAPSLPLGHTDHDVAVAGRAAAFSPMVLCPLHNLGNTCYFNSGVQLLCNCPSLLYTLHDSAFTHKDAAMARRAEVLGYTGGQSSHNMFKSFSDLTARMQFEQLQAGDSIRPSEQLDALAQVNPTFAGRSQQDCSEFVNAVMATIEDEGRLTIQLDQLMDSYARDAKGGVQSMGQSKTTDDESCFTPQEARSTRSFLDTVSTPGSAHNFAVLQLMQDVNTANEALERKTAERKRVSYNNNFQPPRLFFNSVSDPFKGYTLSTIQCHGCKGVSRVVESFTSLMLDLPTTQQRADFARRHPEVQRLGPDGQPLTRKKMPSTFVWWNPITYVTTLFRKLRELCCCGGAMRHPLTLQECLDIHFDGAALRGSNKYKCDACGETCEATKQETLLDVPEYLLLQMKRFKAGSCFNSKKTDPVIFPVSWSPLTAQEATSTTKRAMPEVLDLCRYVDPSIAPYVKPVPARLATSIGRDQGRLKAVSNPVEPPKQQRRSNAPDEAMSPLTEESGDVRRTEAAVPTRAEVPASLTTTYSLEGVVVHHGSYGGGHYTVYVRKLDRGKEAWFYISDDSLEAVQVDEVADAEEYMLLYRKQTPVQPAPEDLKLRDLARFYLRNASKAKPATTICDDAGVVYMSRMWLHRMALMADPGPIINGLCYCSEKEQTRVTGHYALFSQETRVPQDAPHVHGPPADWYYLPVSEADFNAFHAVYGGSRAVTADMVRTVKKEQDRFADLVTRGGRRKK